jgi:F/Y-rich N-terminus/F/Y rich C-terminus
MSVDNSISSTGKNGIVSNMEESGTSALTSKRKRSPSDHTDTGSVLSSDETGQNDTAPPVRKQHRVDNGEHDLFEQKTMIAANIETVQNTQIDNNLQDATQVQATHTLSSAMADSGESGPQSQSQTTAQVATIAEPLQSSQSHIESQSSSSVNPVAAATATATTDAGAGTSSLTVDHSTESKSNDGGDNDRDGETSAVDIIMNNTTPGPGSGSGSGSGPGANVSVSHTSTRMQNDDSAAAIRGVAEAQAREQAQPQAQASAAAAAAAAAALPPPPPPPPPRAPAEPSPFAPEEKIHTRAVVHLPRMAYVRLLDQEHPLIPATPEGVYARLVGENFDFAYDMKTESFSFGKGYSGSDIDYIVRKNMFKSVAKCDVVVGDGTYLSPVHACISFKYDSLQFELRVLGTTGLCINGRWYGPEHDEVAIRSRDVIQFVTNDRKNPRTMVFLCPIGVSVVMPAIAHTKRSHLASANTRCQPHEFEALLHAVFKFGCADARQLRNSACIDRPVSHTRVMLAAALRRLYEAAQPGSNAHRCLHNIWKTTAACVSESHIAELGPVSAEEFRPSAQDCEVWANKLASIHFARRLLYREMYYGVDMFEQIPASIWEQIPVEEELAKFGWSAELDRALIRSVVRVGHDSFELQAQSIGVSETALHSRLERLLRVATSQKLHSDISTAASQVIMSANGPVYRTEPPNVALQWNRQEIVAFANVLLHHGVPCVAGKPSWYPVKNRAGLHLKTDESCFLMFAQLIRAAFHRLAAMQHADQSVTSEADIIAAPEVQSAAIEESITPTPTSSVLQSTTNTNAVDDDNDNNDDVAAPHDALDSIVPNATADKPPSPLLVSETTADHDSDSKIASHQSGGRIHTLLFALQKFCSFDPLHLTNVPDDATLCAHLWTAEAADLFISRIAHLVCLHSLILPHPSLRSLTRAVEWPVQQDPPMPQWWDQAVDNIRLLRGVGTFGMGEWDKIFLAPGAGWHRRPIYCVKNRAVDPEPYNSIISFVSRQLPAVIDAIIQHSMLPEFESVLECKAVVLYDDQDDDETDQNNNSIIHAQAVVDMTNTVLFPLVNWNTLGMPRLPGTYLVDIWTPETGSEQAENKSIGDNSPVQAVSSQQQEQQPHALQQSDVAYSESSSNDGGGAAGGGAGSTAAAAASTPTTVPASHPSLTGVQWTDDHTISCDLKTIPLRPLFQVTPRSYTVLTASSPQFNHDHYPARGQVVIVTCDGDGNVTFPIEFDGGLTVLRSGQINTSCSRFHAEDAIYPVGFVAIRYHQSYENLDNICAYTCEIVEHDGAPRFRITCAADLNNPIEADSADEAWNVVRDRIHFHPDACDTPLINRCRRIDGHERFGLSHPGVRFILERQQDKVAQLQSYRYCPSRIQLYDPYLKDIEPISQVEVLSTVPHVYAATFASSRDIVAQRYRALRQVSN